MKYISLQFVTYYKMSKTIWMDLKILQDIFQHVRKMQSLDDILDPNILPGKVSLDTSLHIISVLDN